MTCKGVISQGKVENELMGVMGVMGVWHLQIWGSVFRVRWRQVEPGRSLGHVPRFADLSCSSGCVWHVNM
jgi:hypothetical protein